MLYLISVPSGKVKPEKYFAPSAFAIFSKSWSENFPVFKRWENADCDSPIRLPSSVFVIPATVQAISIFCCIVIFITSNLLWYLYYKWFHWFLQIVFFRHENLNLSGFSKNNPTTFSNHLIIFRVEIITHPIIDFYICHSWKPG